MKSYTQVLQKRFVQQVGQQLTGIVNHYKRARNRDVILQVVIANILYNIHETHKSGSLFSCH